MKKRILTLLTLLALLLGCIAGFAPGALAAASQADSHINIALFTYIEGMDPAVDWCGWNLTRCGEGETLVTNDENMQLAGQLADSWEQVDEVTYRFHIRKGVKFSNGTDLTPEIVKDSIERSIGSNSRGGSLKLESITVDGEDVEVSAEVYQAYSQADRRERYQAERDAGLVLSLNKLAEDEMQLSYLTDRHIESAEDATVLNVMAEQLRSVLHLLEADEMDLILCLYMLDSMDDGRIALCDAGVGLGKTYAYLSPDGGPGTDTELSTILQVSSSTVRKSSPSAEEKAPGTFSHTI